MKTIVFFLLVTTEICYAQMIPHKATITTSKDSILSNETFTVTYSLTGVKGYVYIGVKEGFFETIGKDRWEGKINEGETKTVAFTVKLKESGKRWIHKNVLLIIGFSYKPFGKKVWDGIFDDVRIRIIDFKEMKFKIKANEPLAKPGHGNLKWIEPGDLKWLKPKKQKVDTTIKPQQYFN